MSRHNRRRTRGGHSQKAMNNTLPPSNNITTINAGGMMPYMFSYYAFPPSLPPVHVHPHVLTRNLPPPPGLNPPLWAPASFHSLGMASGTNLSAPASKITTAPTRPSSNARTGVSARHWHNRYMAWQAREKRQREESARLQAEKARIFGSRDTRVEEGAETGSGRDAAATAAGVFEDGDEDEELCRKMLEYFGGLDFIEW